MFTGQRPTWSEERSLASVEIRNLCSLKRLVCTPPSARTARKPHQDVYRTGPVPSGFCSHNKHLHTLLFRSQHLRPKNMGRSDFGRFVSTPAILARSRGELQSPEITQTHTRHTTSPHANVRQKTRSIHDPLEFPVLAQHHHFTTHEERPSVTLSNTRSKKKTPNLQCHVYC